MFTVGVGIALKGFNVSGGKHFNQLTLDQVRESMEWWFLLELFYTVTITLNRASLAVFLRITVVMSHIIIIWTTLAIITGYSVFCFSFVIFQCNPLSAFWTEAGGNSSCCVAATTFGIITHVHSGLGAVADWILALLQLLLPVIMVSGLQMNIRTKFSVCFILGLGGM